MCVSCADDDRMTLEAALPIPVILPICGAVVAPLATRLHRRAPLYLAIVAVVGGLAVLGVVAARVYGGHGRLVAHFLSNEHPEHGRVLGIAFVADPFGMTFALLVLAVGTILLVSLLSELGDLGRRELGALAALVQLLLAALVGSALSADAVNLFVWFEVAGLASFGLTGFFLERPIALEAAFKNLVLTSIAGFVVFAGAGVLYRTTGALDFGQLHNMVPVRPSHAQLLAIALLVGGFATKAGLVPFHGWLPDAHTPVPGAISALFSALMVGLGVIALARTRLLLFPDLTHLPGMLTAVGIVSAVIGAALALVQDDLKRLLAWDTVSQTGILVAGFAGRTDEGVAGAVYHLVNHALFKSLLFLCAGAVVHSTGLTRLSELGGLVRRRPFLTTGFVIGCAAISGVPPLNGYASLELIHSGLEDQPVAYAGALLAQVITVAALSRAAWLGFLRPRRENYEQLTRPHAGMRISWTLLAAGCIAFGVLPAVFVPHVVAPAASILLHPATYAAAALGQVSAVPHLAIELKYLDPATLAMALGEVLVGIGVAYGAIRRGAKVLDPLRRIHTGSVNDYATFQVVGIVVTAAVLLW
jgi:multicomponent Na+:H+ antiporter subunit D